MASPYDFQSNPFICSYQQQDPPQYVEGVLDPEAQLLIVGDWTRSLAVRLSEIRIQLQFTLSGLDQRSTVWFAWNDYLAEQFDMLSVAISTHRYWLFVLQQDQYNWQPEPPVVESPQDTYKRRLAQLNERLEETSTEGPERKGDETTLNDGHVCHPPLVFGGMY